MTTRYRIIDNLAGEGGFGRVAKARDTDLDRDVAIKTLDPLFKIEPSPQDIERFRREARTLARLSHPNIPAIYDVHFDEMAKEFRLIGEWIEGVTVLKSLRDRGVMSLDEVRKWFGNVCSALSHAHSKGIFHRDVKPANMVITIDHEACYLVDFGIAIAGSDLNRLTEGTNIGTPGYMSPEQENGEEVNAASDVFSLGVVLYECLCGTRPRIGDYKPLNLQNEAIPPAIDELVRSSIVTKKNARIQSASEFYTRLSRALRPSSSFQSVLVDGALHEIQNALTSIDSDEYVQMPAGQRRLLISRLKDLDHVDQPRLRNAVASILAELVRVAHRGREADYELITKLGFEYGYRTKYSENWTGNIQVREGLNAVCKDVHDVAHKIMTNAALQFLAAEGELINKEHWFYHDIRILLQNLLGNGHCDEGAADSLGDFLDKINQISH